MTRNCPNVSRFILFWRSIIHNSWYWFQIGLEISILPHIRAMQMKRKKFNQNHDCLAPPVFLFNCRIWYEANHFKWHMTDDDNDDQNAAQIYTCH